MASSDIDWSSATNVGEIRVGTKTVLKVRKVAGKIDVRKFVDAAKYSGPTRDGHLLDADQAETLARLLLEAAGIELELRDDRSIAERVDAGEDAAEIVAEAVEAEHKREERRETGPPVSLHKQAEGAVDSVPAGVDDAVYGDHHGGPAKRKARI